MPTLGLLFVFGGVFLAYQVARGRAKNVPGDARDFVVGAFTGDINKILHTARQPGTASVAPGASTSLETTGAGTGTASGATLLSMMQSLGQNASYKYAGTGPDQYDCSGLVWRAMTDLGIYNGSRFSSSTWAVVAPQIGATQVDSPAVGDIVVWPGKHMGIVTGPDQMYSALNPSNGIITSSISDNTGYVGEDPQYWRLPDG